MEGCDVGLSVFYTCEVIFGHMKLTGITVSIIAWEKGMGRALTGMGGVHSSSLFARDAAKSSWNRFWLAVCSA